MRVQKRRRVYLVDRKGFMVTVVSDLRITRWLCWRNGEEDISSRVESITKVQRQKNTQKVF